MNSFVTYRCYRCRQSFSRLANREPDNRVACFYGDCEGWMYPVDPREDFQDPRLYYVNAIIGLLFILGLVFLLVSFLSVLLR